MNYNVFISHNINEENFKIINTLESQIPRYISLYVAEHDSEPGVELKKKIENALLDSDAMIVILTSSGNTEWVNQEIGYAKAHNKLIIPLVEKGMRTKAFIEGIEWIEIDLDKPEAACKKVRKALDKKVKIRIKEQREKEGFWKAVAVGIGLIIVIIIMFILMKSSRNK